MVFPRDDNPDQRRARDLHELRILAWCVKRDKYRAEPWRVEGGRRGKGRIVTFVWYIEQADYAEADRAVRQLERALPRAGANPPARHDAERRSMSSSHVRDGDTKGVE